jgi:hypothetical protein
MVIIHIEWVVGYIHAAKLCLLVYKCSLTIDRSDISTINSSQPAYKKNLAKKKRHHLNILT